jgi:hypothetical protein
MKHIFQRIDEAIKYKGLTHSKVDAILGNSRGTTSYWIKQESISLDNFFKLLEGINKNPCEIINQNIIKDDLEQSVIYRTNSTVQTQRIIIESLKKENEILRELANSYKTRLIDTKMKE